MIVISKQKGKGKDEVKKKRRKKKRRKKKIIIKGGAGARRKIIEIHLGPRTNVTSYFLKRQIKNEIWGLG